MVDPQLTFTYSRSAYSISVIEKALWRFRELTSKEDTAGVQTGLRTLIVHHGRRLQDVVPNPKEREKLFLELWRYCYSVLHDLVEMSSKSREELKQHRKDLRTAIGIVIDESDQRGSA